MFVNGTRDICMSLFGGRTLVCNVARGSHSKLKHAREAGQNLPTSVIYGNYGTWADCGAKLTNAVLRYFSSGLTTVPTSG